MCSYTNSGIHYLHLLNLKKMSRLMLWITNFNAPVEVFIRAEASWPLGDHASNDTEAIWSVGHKHQIKITELMKTGFSATGSSKS